MKICYPRRGIYHVSLLTIAASIALAMASFTEIFHICKPFAAQWDPHVLGTCGNQILSFTVLETVGLVLDLVLFSLPCIFVRRLLLGKWKKVSIIVGMDAGAL